MENPPRPPLPDPPHQNVVNAPFAPRAYALFAAQFPAQKPDRPTPPQPKDKPSARKDLARPALPHFPSPNILKG
jgi:hypothetical protein